MRPWCCSSLKSTWPACSLAVTAVDAGTGEGPRIWRAQPWQAVWIESVCLSTHLYSVSHRAVKSYGDWQEELSRQRNGSLRLFFSGFLFSLSSAHLRSGWSCQFIAGPHRKTTAIGTGTHAYTSLPVLNWPNMHLSESGRKLEHLERTREKDEALQKQGIKLTTFPPWGDRSWPPQQPPWPTLTTLRVSL